MNRKGISRRDFLKVSGVGVMGLAGVAGLRAMAQPTVTIPEPAAPMLHGSDHYMGGPGVAGKVDHAANGFDPAGLLTDFDYGEVTEENGRTVRQWEILAMDKEIEVAPGVYFPAWAYGSSTSAESKRAGHIVGRVPGPTFRCVEGELLRYRFINAGSHPHTIHFHGIHPATMDGVPGIGVGLVYPGATATYEFTAAPFGCHLYHCHANPLKKHIHKGLYGAFIIDPDPEKYSGREQEIARSRNHRYEENKAVHEMVMVMNAFDTNFDGENEIYAVNSVAFAYMTDPITAKRDTLQRLYLVNLTEFDLINSFHLHANMFHYYDHGTTFEPTLRTVDTIVQCQGQRGILEFSFKDFLPGLYMFHAHQSEFAELGWMGFFGVS